MLKKGLSLCRQVVSRDVGGRGIDLLYLQKHKNPCFYRKNATSNFTILAKDVPQLLEDGDEFSLLPKELIFKVEKIKTDSSPDEAVLCLS